MAIASLHVTIVSPIASICTRTEYGVCTGFLESSVGSPGQRIDQLLDPGFLPGLESAHGAGERLQRIGGGSMVRFRTDRRAPAWIDDRSLGRPRPAQAAKK